MTNQERAQNIRWILMDVDGTLTDGTLLVFPDGEELKTYNVRDGLGILLAHLAGLKTGIITGKTSRSLEIRSEKLKITEVHQGILDKKPVLDEILERNGVTAQQVAFIGDDLGDLEVIKTVGFSAAVADAHCSRPRRLRSTGGGRWDSARGPTAPTNDESRRRRAGRWRRGCRR